MSRPDIKMKVLTLTLSNFTVNTIFYEGNTYIYTEIENPTFDVRITAVRTKLPALSENNCPIQRASAFTCCVRKGSRIFSSMGYLPGCSPLLYLIRNSFKLFFFSTLTCYYCEGLLFEAYFPSE